MLDKADFTKVYTPQTRQNHEGEPGTFSFYLARTWSSTTATTVQVEVSDTQATSPSTRRWSGRAPAGLSHAAQARASPDAVSESEDVRASQFDHVRRLPCTSCADRLRRSASCAPREARCSTLALAPARRAARAASARRQRSALTARNIGRRYAGDRSLFATVSPGVPGRDTAAVRFTLNRAAT